MRQDNTKYFNSLKITFIPHSEKNFPMPIGDNNFTEVEKNVGYQLESKNISILYFYYQ